MSTTLLDKKSKILVADDDLGILEVIKIILEENNFQVLAISDGGDVESSLDKFKPDLIIMDIWMSGYDGRDITKLLKSKKETNLIPIIVLSAHNDARKMAMEAGADDCLEKPFEMNELLNMIHKHLH